MNGRLNGTETAVGADLIVTLTAHDEADHDQDRADDLRHRQPLVEHDRTQHEHQREGAGDERVRGREVELLNAAIQAKAATTAPSKELITQGLTRKWPR